MVRRGTREIGPMDLSKVDAIASMQLAAFEAANEGHVDRQLSHSRRKPNVANDSVDRRFEQRHAFIDGHRIQEDVGHGKERIQQEEMDYGIDNAYETTMAKANHQVQKGLERSNDGHGGFLHWVPTQRYSFGMPVRDQNREDCTFHTIQHFNESRPLLRQLRNNPDPFTLGNSNVTSHLNT